MLDYFTDWVIAMTFYNYFKVMNIQLSMANFDENEKKILPSQSCLKNGFQQWNSKCKQR